MNYGKLTAGTTKTAIDTAKPSEKGEIITYLSRMGAVLKKIADGSQLVLTFVGVDVVRNSDQPNVVIGEELLSQSADLDVVTTQAAEICSCNQKTKKYIASERKSQVVSPGFLGCNHV